jgi:hypothetical protein
MLRKSLKDLLTHDNLVLDDGQDLDKVNEHKEEEVVLEESKKKTLKNSNPCWKGYHPVGTKEKNGRTVPNCVPKE